VTDQVTAVFDVPVTEAERLAVWHPNTLVDPGVTVTVTTGGGPVTVTVAAAVRLGSAWLVATTWQVAETAGAV
jgi:hypothetical protein